MSTSPPSHSSGGDGKKITPPSSNIVTRNGARKAKIQTRAMAAGSKPPVVREKKKGTQKKQPIDTMKDYFKNVVMSQDVVRGKTAVVTDPLMVEHHCPWDPDYPECPERLIEILKRCEELGLLQACERIPARAATREELLVLHAPAVLDLLRLTHHHLDQDLLEDISSHFDAIYIHPTTHEAALLAAGSTIELVSRVVRGEVGCGAALVRPPGHHAMRAEPCGYCLYNNVALAARHAVDQLGLRRVLIVDWDVHHGQATQQMFYDDPRVVYFSVHRYEHGSFWPNLRQSDYAYVGSGRGAGANFNVPLNQVGMGDADYLAIWHNLLLPMALEFQPELVLVSAGYDAALGCPEGEMCVTAACYAWLTQLLVGVAPRVVVVLEGGYCVPALAEAAALTLRTLLGHAPPPLQPLAPPSHSIHESILNCIYVHKPYWRCFQYQPTYSTDTSVPNVSDLHKEKHLPTLRWAGDETRPHKFATRDCYPVQDEGVKAQLLQRLEHLRSVTELALPRHQVCYVYDEAMLKHRNICEPAHVECPDRIVGVHDRHRQYGLLSRVHPLPARAATDEEILTVHTQDHLDRLKDLSSLKLRELHQRKESFESVYFHPDSLESARVAAGGVLQAVEAVVSGQAGAGVCVVRPPGHHAAGGAPGGFCLVNSAALAARHAVLRLGLTRVLLLDWDVHHGDGSQQILYHMPEVLYMSIHRYDNGAFFPHSRAANYDRVGEGRGEGYNVNIPWNKRGMGDTEYLAALTQVVLPVATHFAPQLVLVSAGFDACVGDPLGECKVSPECFGQMTSFLRTLAGGKVVLCLEGGYNVKSTSYAMTMCTKALLGDPIPRTHDPSVAPHASAVETINNVIQVQKKYWKCLNFNLALPSENVLEPLAPSRGLVTSESEANITTESESLSESLCSTLNNSRKSQSMELSLENVLANLSLGPNTQCVDGNCGTDDEGKEDAQHNKEKASCKDEIKNEDSPKDGGSSEDFNKPGTSRGTSENKTLVDYLADNMNAIVNEDMFAVIPLPWCPHVDTLPAIPEGLQFQQGAKCMVCQDALENWVCLHCFVTACARNIGGHMQEHCRDTGHALVLSLLDLSVWCNECDAYVDHARLYHAKNNAHRNKFGEPMPWCYHTDTIHLE